MELTPRNYYGFVNTMQSLAGETFISPAFLMEDEELTKAIKMNSTNLDNREWFIAGIETAAKIDKLIELIKGENK